MQIHAYNSTHEINDKFKNVSKDLSQGKWVNDKLSTQNKNFRVVRILKRIISALFGDMFSHIRTDRVALALFANLEANSKHVNPETKNLAYDILNKLNTRTKGKYAVQINACKRAISTLNNETSIDEGKPSAASGTQNNSLADALKNGKKNLGKSNAPKNNKVNAANDNTSGNAPVPPPPPGAGIIPPPPPGPATSGIAANGGPKHYTVDTGAAPKKEKKLFAHDGKEIKKEDIEKLGNVGAQLNGALGTNHKEALKNIQKANESDPKAHESKQKMLEQIRKNKEAAAKKKAEEASKTNQI